MVYFRAPIRKTPLAGQSSLQCPNVELLLHQNDSISMHGGLHKKNAEAGGSRFPELALLEVEVTSS